MKRGRAGSALTGRWRRARGIKERHKEEKPLGGEGCNAEEFPVAEVV